MYVQEIDVLKDSLDQHIDNLTPPSAIDLETSCLPYHTWRLDRAIRSIQRIQSLSESNSQD